jgi:hypothetical protein
MSESIPGRIRGITILAGLLFGVAGVAGAESSALAPIDPFCHPAGLSQCVLVEIDPGIYLPEGEPHPDRGIHLPEWPWIGAIEVGYTEAALVCESEIPRAPAPGCIDVSELSRIVPKIELPGDRQ